MSDQTLLSAYQKADDIDIDQWLMADSKQPKAQEKPAEQPAQQQEKPGFFKSSADWLAGKAESAGGAIRSMTGGEKDAGATGRGNEGVIPSLGRAAATIPEGFAEGTKTAIAPGKGKPGFIELPGGGGFNVPAGLMDFGERALGAIQAFTSFSKGAGSAYGDFSEWLEKSSTDEALDAQIAQTEELVKNGATDKKQELEFLKLWRMKPYDERLKIANESGQFAGEMMSSLVSGYTGAAKLAGKALGPATKATAAAREARIAAVAAAGERVASKPPLALPEHAGPSRIGGAIPQPESPLTQAAPASDRLRALMRDPEAQRAIEEWWQENKIVRPGQEPQGPGLSRVEANMSREELRARPAPGELRSRMSLESEAKAKGLTPQENLHRILSGDEDYAVLSAERSVLSPEENVQRTAALKERLEADGYKPIPAEGHYGGNPEKSFVVPGLDANKALEYGSEFEQESVLTKHGLVYTADRSVNPADLSKIDFSGAQTDYFTKVRIGGEDVKFSIPIDFETKGLLPSIAGRVSEPATVAQGPTKVKAYHGTQSTFDEYKTGAETRDGGTWFSTSPETAGARAMGESGDMGAVAGEAPQVRPVQLTLRNVATEEQFRDARMLMQGDTQLASELMKSKGYDAVRFERPEIGPTPNYLVFDPAKTAVPHFGEMAAPLETAVEAAKKRIAARFKEIVGTGEEGAVQLRGSFAEGWEKNKQLVNDLATVGSAYLWEGTRAFKEWSARMVAEFGEQITPHLQAIYEKAQERIGSLVKEGVQSKLTSAKAMLEKAKAGEFAGGWYDDAKAEFDRMFGANADLFADLVAATSPNMDVKSNISLALKAMEKIMKGERGVGNYFKTEDGFLGAHLQNLNRILDGKPISGPKVGEFARAIKGDRDAVVVDTWMLRAFGMTDMATKVNPTPARVKFIQQAVQDIARELGMDNRQAQAAIWSAQKIASEGEQEIKPLAEMVKDALEGKGLLDREWVFPNKLDETLPSWVTEEGRINLGVLSVLGRAAVGGTLGAMTGDDPESSVRNFLLAAGVSSLLSPKLAKTILKNMADPEVRDALKQAVKMQGEQGAINPAPRPKREPLKVTQENAGGSSESRALIRGINARLEKAGLLDRSGVQSHEATREAALRSPYRTVEAVLGLDEAKLSLDELASAKVAVKDVRDFVAEDAIQTAAKAKLTQDPALFKEAIDKTLLAGKVSQKWADLETAGGRFVEASKIKSQAAVASKYDLDEFSKELVEMRSALAERGKVSDVQLVEMLTNLADRAAAAKIASVASRWPEALWNIYYGLNLMGSPITHFRNMLGNLGGLGMAVVDRGFGEIIAAPFHVAGKGKNMVQPGETYELMKGIYEAVADSFRGGNDTKGALGYARDAYKTGESIFGVGKETEALRVVAQASEAGEGTLPRVIQVMSTLAQKNLKFMGGTDEFFKVLSFNGEIRSLAQRSARSKGLRGQELLAEINRLIDEPTTDMLAQATAFAKENTFTKAFTPGTWGKAVETATQFPASRLLLTPFYRTPMRIAEFSTVHTPILNVLAKQFWSDVRAGGVKANLAAAKLATGTAALGLMGWFAVHNYITGDWPSDPNLRAKYEAAGWQPRSIYNPVNGKYYSYDNIEPLSTLVSTAANFVQIARDLPEWDAQTLFMAGTIATSKSILSKQWFQGLSDLSDVIQAASRGEDVGKGLVFLHRRLASLIPGAAIGRTFNKMTDDQKRETQLVIDNENPELREFSKLTSIYTQNVAGWGWLVPFTKPRPAMVNMITGEPMANENTWLQAINPFQVTTFKNDKVLNELVALDGAGLPKEIPRIIGGSQPASEYKLPGDEAKAIKEGVILNDEERQRLGVLLTKEVEDADGNTLHQSLAELMDSDEYDDASETGKKTLVQKRFHSFLKQAERELLDEYPKLDQIVARRRVERGNLKLPKSMEDIKDFAREAVESR